MTIESQADEGRVSTDVNDRAYLGFGTKAIYGLGDVASQLAWSLGTSYLTVFYTDSVGLATGAVAVLMLAARILDAVVDPLIGGLSERTRSRFGRFRPWILFGSPVLAVMVVLTFTAPFGNGGAGFGWAIGTYMVLGVVYSVVNVPYGSLSMVLSPSTRDRVALNSVRLIGTNVGAVLISLVSAPLIIQFSGKGGAMTVRGYTLTALVMGVLSLVLFLALFFRTKEVVTPVRRERATPKSTLTALMSNRSLLALAVAFLLVMLGFFGRMSTVIYYLINNVGRPDLIGPLMMVPSLAGVVGIVAFANPAIARRVGKKRLAIIGSLGSAAALLLLTVVGWSNLWVVVILSAVYGIANFSIAIMMSMVPDTIDDGEVRTGIRSDGTGYASVSFAQKVGTAVGASVGVALLGAFGYAAGAHPTAEVLDGINVVANVFPAAAFILAVVPLAFYRISEDRNDANTARLEAMRASAGDDV
ncbi:MFS transporter [Streptomyces mayonensis]|uniref:MFS transporter n=1 Tax=Streptomyces mayonensis TaxID=2750816 RepID=UPI001C1E7EEE|nr:glycoside-pentoside-hexuronide (GPH):cation symporter [Streptomyces sp. A108]MBU6529624.1 MFS transporter [Streptomyces sp. A108]